MPSLPHLVQVPSSGEHGESPCFQVLGVRVDAVQIEDVIKQMEEWIHENRMRENGIRGDSIHEKKTQENGPPESAIQ